jgi:hypothetical protein
MFFKVNHAQKQFDSDQIQKWNPEFILSFGLRYFPPSVILDLFFDFLLNDRSDPVKYWLKIAIVAGVRTNSIRLEPSGTMVLQADDMIQTRRQFRFSFDTQGYRRSKDKLLSNPMLW